MDHKYLVLSLNRAPVLRVHLDPVCGASPEHAMRAMARIRSTSDIIAALTPNELNAYAAWLKDLAPQSFPPVSGTNLEKYLVFSLNRHTQEVQVHPAQGSTRDQALQTMAALQPASDIIFALTPEQLVEYAVRLNEMTPQEIQTCLDNAQHEEDTFQGNHTL